MGRSVIGDARRLIRRRKFGFAIRLLETNQRGYEGSFEFYLALGTACLYVGDEGNASKYYRQARDIRLNNSELLIGQAAIHLRHGDTARALEYYLDVLNTDPSNEVARRAMDFIRLHGGDYDAIVQLKSSGRIEQFYPPLGMNPDIIRNCVLGGALAVLAAAVVVAALPARGARWTGPRADLKRFELTAAERQDALDAQLSGDAVLYLLDGPQVNRSYEGAVNALQDFHDNLAQVEINRLLNSNASTAIKRRALDLEAYLWPRRENGAEEPTFGTLPSEDRFAYALVENDHPLYDKCFVVWRGMVANVVRGTDGSCQFDLLVGYEGGVSVLGKVPVDCPVAPYPPLDASKPIEVLGRVGERDGRLVLTGRSYFQPIRGKFAD